MKKKKYPKRMPKENMAHVSVLNQLMTIMSIHVENTYEGNCN